MRGKYAAFILEWHRMGVDRGMEIDRGVMQTYHRNRYAIQIGDSGERHFADGFNAELWTDVLTSYVVSGTRVIGAYVNERTPEERDPE